MKTKKFLTSIVLIVLCVGMVLGLTACGSPFKDEYSQVVFEDYAFIAGVPENLKVNSVVAYYYNYYYYYCIDCDIKVYGTSGDFEKNEIIEVYTGQYVYATFTEKTGPEFFLHDYDKYLEAKEKGEKKVFTEEEIQKYVDIAFQKLDK